MTAITTPAVEPVVVPGSKEWDAKMAAIAQAARQEAPNPYVENGVVPAVVAPVVAPEVATRPDNVPEKFWDAAKGAVNTEALLKSYTELEKGKTPVAAPVAGAPVAIDVPAADKAAGDAVAAAGLNMDALTTKLATNGKLDEADYVAFEKAGIPRAMVDDYTALKTDKATNDAIAYAGGEAAKNELFDWASKNLPEADIVNYNKMLASTQWQAALDAIKGRRASAKGSGEPALVTGPRAADGGLVTGYQDTSERNADMKNPIYQQNTPAGAKFRAEVMEKTRLATWNRK